jgi:hypothetical protein
MSSPSLKVGSNLLSFRLAGIFATDVYNVLLVLFGKGDLDGVISDSDRDLDDILFTLDLFGVENLTFDGDRTDVKVFVAVRGVLGEYNLLTHEENLTLLYISSSVQIHWPENFIFLVSVLKRFPLYRLPSVSFDFGFVITC